MTVNTRAIDLRTVLLQPPLDFTPQGMQEKDAHLGELRRRATSDLLYPKTQELRLQLSELLRQVILGPGRSTVSNELPQTSMYTHLDWSSYALTLPGSLM